MYIPKSHNVYYENKGLISTLRVLMGSVLLAVWLGSVGFSVIVAAALAGAI